MSSLIAHIKPYLEQLTLTLAPTDATRPPGRTPLLCSPCTKLLVAACCSPPTHLALHAKWRADAAPVRWPVLCVASPRELEDGPARVHAPRLLPRLLGGGDGGGGEGGGRSCSSE